MKSRVVIGIFLLLTIAVGTASAQTAIHPSIKAGLNFATLSGDFGSDADKGIRVGGVFGAGISTPVNDKWTLDVDFLYSMEGAKLTITEGSQAEKGTVQVDYIRIPLLFRSAVGSGPRAAYVVIGPSIGFLTRAKAKFVGETLDLKDDFKKADFGIAFGAGANLNEKIFIEARYTLGLTDVNSDDSDVASRNRVFTILIGGRL